MKTWRDGCPWILAGLLCLAADVDAQGKKSKFKLPKDWRIDKATGRILKEHGGPLRLTEYFGVSHSSQPVEFAVTPAAGGKLPPAGTLKRSDGQWTPYQALSRDRIVLVTDLPANARFTWELSSAKRVVEGEIPNALKVGKHDGLHEISNGLIGLRVPGEGGGLLAPVQGIMYPDGTWTEGGVNPMAGAASGGMKVRFVDSGPVKVEILVEYSFGGGKYHRCTLQMHAGRPSIWIEDEGNSRLEYTFSVAKGLNPNEGRRRFGAPENPEATFSVGSGKAGRMATWDPWCGQGGRGWWYQIYASNGSDNLFGIFTGPASRVVAGNQGGAEISGAGVSFSLDAENKSGVRIPWGIHAGLRSRDLGDGKTGRAIGRELNLYGGINLSKLVAYELDDYPDPKGGYGSMYMNSSKMAKLIQKVQQDPGYYGHLRQAENFASPPILDLWKNGAAGAKPMIDQLRSFAKGLLDEAAWEGVYANKYIYFHGGQAVGRFSVYIDQLLTWKGLAKEDRDFVKAAGALFSGYICDDDVVPLSTWRINGLNLGTANMPISQMGQRHLYAMLLSGHPAMAARMDGIETQVLETILNTINDHGTHQASTHYIDASLGPALSALQQLQVAGIYDAFKKEKRFAKFAEFYMNLMTPPEPRFGNIRKVVSIGDAYTGGFCYTGQLATCFAESDPALSKRLMGAWRECGAPHSGVHGSSIIKIDESLPSADPNLGSARFPGFFTVLRNGWGTPGESALWLVDGNFYADHAHNDYGTVVIYALGAPLSIDWGSMYSPRVAGGLMHSLCLPESGAGAWKQNGHADSGGTWGAPTPLSFKDGAASAGYKMGGTVWTRTVGMGPLGSDLFVVGIQDSFQGNESMIFTLNLMAEGAVETPEGSKNPGQDLAFAAGVNRLGFTGATWSKHAGGGIDFAAYVIAPEPQEGYLATFKHNWHPSNEQNQFKTATGRDFEEAQHILRIKGKEFRVVLVAWPKDKKPADLQVTSNGGSVSVSAGGRSVRVDRSGSVQ